VLDQYFIELQRGAKIERRAKLGSACGRLKEGVATMIRIVKQRQKRSGAIFA
jgi:hypothetical protein